MLVKLLTVPQMKYVVENLLAPTNSFIVFAVVRKEIIPAIFPSCPATWIKARFSVAYSRETNLIRRTRSERFFRLPRISRDKSNTLIVFESLAHFDKPTQSSATYFVVVFQKDHEIGRHCGSTAT